MLGDPGPARRSIPPRFRGAEVRHGCLPDNQYASIPSTTVKKRLCFRRSASVCEILGIGPASRLGLVSSSLVGPWEPETNACTAPPADPPLRLTDRGPWRAGCPAGGATLALRRAGRATPADGRRAADREDLEGHGTEGGGAPRRA